MLAKISPSTPAAPPSQFSRGGELDPVARRARGEALALDIESRRRMVSLSFALLFIPASAAAAIGGSALVGVPMVLLPVCALLGLAVGPALTTASLALANLLGAPGARRRFCARAAALGLSAGEQEEIWRGAVEALDVRARERLQRRATKELS